MKKLMNSVLVSSMSIITGIIVFLFLSGIFVQGFHPLAGIVEATSAGSFDYLTNVLYYETSEVSFNMEDLYNSTHLYDFSEYEHLGRMDSSLEFDTGVYGQSLRWPSGQILCEDLDIIDSSFTLEAWIFPTSQSILSLGGVETIYPFIWKAENGSMQYQYSGGSAVLYSSQAVKHNAWTHVALVYDHLSGIAGWYLNGSEQGSKFVGYSRDWDGLWCIGHSRPDYTSNEWKGKIDEFRIYKNEARAQVEIQDDMKTSIAHKLTITGLAPNSDIAQLSYLNGEFARMHLLQETADEYGQVEFSVYSFSGRVPYYEGILKVVRSGKTYTSPVLELSWEDVYHFSSYSFFDETLIAGIISVSIVIIPLALLLIYRHMHSRPKVP